MSELPIEYCGICGHETGHAGRADDSIYIDCGNDELGPLCDDCLRGLKAWCYDDDGITPEETETPRRSALDAEVVRVLEKAQHWIVRDPLSAEEQDDFTATENAIYELLKNLGGGE